MDASLSENAMEWHLMRCSQKQPPHPPSYPRGNSRAAGVADKVSPRRPSEPSVGEGGETDTPKSLQQPEPGAR